MIEPAAATHIYAKPPGSRPTFPLTDRSNLYDAILPYAAEVTAASKSKHGIQPLNESTISELAQEAASGKQTRHDIVISTLLLGPRTV